MQQEMRRRSLVLFSMSLVGHQNVILGLARILHSKGFSISVISTREGAPNPTNYPPDDFTFHLIDDGLSESDRSTLHGLHFVKAFNNKCVGPFRVCLSQILSNASADDDDDHVACIIADAMCHFSKAVADELELPWIALHTSSVPFFTDFFVHPFLREKRHLALKDPEDPIPELPPLRVKDIVTCPGDDQSPVDDMLHNQLKATNTSKGLIVNSFEGFNDLSLTIARHNCPIPVFPIGPFHKYLQAASSTNSPSKSRDQTIISWLDTQAPNSVLYVSFGSLARISIAWFLEVAWGLATCSNHPFLWVVRSDLVCGPDGSSCHDQLPDGFLEGLSGRGRVVPWAPQKEVLAHPAVGGFWTHCGWNSTLESICEGVPMICTPMFGDQMLNARYVTHVWKIGFELDMDANREDVGKVIGKLMAVEDHESQEVRERVECLKNKARNCLMPGGSSYKYMEDLVHLIMSF